MFNGRETEYSNEEIHSTGFWGNIHIGEFQRQRAIPIQIPLELTKSALIYAMQSVEFDLAELTAKYQASGIHNVEGLAGTQINGENNLRHLYKKAVFARAKHELLPEFATLSSRDLHEKRDVITEQKQLLSEATMAIRALKGKRRGGVYLL